MARYNVRDLLGHWVRPRSARGDLCPHSCCQNRRVHPEDWPAYLKPRMLRTSTDEQLAEHYTRHGDCEKCRGQILGEMERRDVRETKAKTARQRRFARSIERQEAIETAWQAAERDTRGVMLNAKGRARGIDERSLFTGSEDRAMRYASDELKAHWERNPRPTRAQLSGNPEAIRRERAGSNLGRQQASSRPPVRSRTITTGRGRDRRTVHVSVVPRDRLPRLPWSLGAQWRYDDRARHGHLPQVRQPVGVARVSLGGCQVPGMQRGPARPAVAR